MSNCWKRIPAVISQQMKAARQEQGDSHPQQVLSTEKSQFFGDWDAFGIPVCLMGAQGACPALWALPGPVQGASPALWTLPGPVQPSGHFQDSTGSVSISLGTSRTFPTLWAHPGPALGKCPAPWALPGPVQPCGHFQGQHRERVHPCGHFQDLSISLGASRTCPAPWAFQGSPRGEASWAAW